MADTCLAAPLSGAQACRRSSGAGGLEVRVACFGGCTPGVRPVVPVGARLIWDDPPLWTMGTSPSRLVRTLARRSSRLAVFGPCSASEAELARALVSPALPAAAGTWAGSHTIVRARGTDTVEIVTDTAGACPVYMVRRPDGAVWCSSSWVLSGLAGGQVDTEWLAAHLLHPQADVCGRSAWAGVGLVPAGHRVVLRGGVAQVSPWWAISRRGRAGAAARLRDALAEGVRERVAGGASSCDVAGLDSSTLAVLASRDGPVLGMTVHPAGVAEGGDVTYARALAETLPGLRHVLFPLGERHLPLSEAEVVLPATDEPAPSSATWSRFSAQLQATARHGIACHLTGDGGDTLFLPPPTHLADLARTGRWGRLAADAQAWALLRRVSPWGLLAAAVLRDGHALACGGGRRPVWLGAAAPGRPAAPGAGAGAGAGAGGLSDALLLAEVRYAARSARAECQLASALGIELHNPYLDGAVLDAVLSVPAWERCSATRYKPLLVDAVGPLLPAVTRQRSTKGVFIGEFHRGVRANLRRVLALTDGRLAGLGLLYPAPLRAAVHAAALGAETAWPALLPTLNAELWLAAVERTPAARWHGGAAGAP